MLALIEAGGFVMIPLLICSILVWGVSLEKIWFLLKIRKQIGLLYVKAEELITEGKKNEARGLSLGIHVALAGPYRALFEGIEEREREIHEGQIGRRLLESRSILRKYLWILGTIGASAPFIGLFGTVVGIIKSFESIALSGKSGFAVVAAGLSEALIATATGIIVAVMAVVFYNYFQSRLADINMEYKNRVEDLLDILRR